ncbi:hypothetical protein HYR69_06585 [Candidatus Sumerlaeota bacterium]|nr:hypothetical protein [Candidatus Sumerlaeota bacterium]
MPENTDSDSKPDAEMMRISTECGIATRTALQMGCAVTLIGLTGWLFGSIFVWGFGTWWFPIIWIAGNFFIVNRIARRAERRLIEALQKSRRTQDDTE